MFVFWRRNPDPVFSALSSCLRFISVNADGVARLAYTPAAMDAGTPDEELMQRFSGGDASAFDALYSRHRGGVFRYLLRQCGNRAAAEELFQDIWMNLVQARSRYKVEAKFSTYLYTLAHNRLMDHFRRRKGVDLVSLDQDEDDPLELPASATLQPERAAESREQAARLLSLVDALPAAQREAFLLQEEGGLSLEEIAQVTGSNREAVKSRLRYALNKLRDGMKDYL
jgi:RNA polymerase sigma-70 factor (ECF subfamily)